MRRRLSAQGWLWLAIAVAVVVLTCVGAPLAVRLYDVPLAPALGLSALHAFMIAAAMLRPRSAGAVAVLVLCLLTALADPGGGPWPWAVVWLLVQLLVVGVVAVRASWSSAVVLAGASVLGSTSVGLAGLLSGDGPGLGAVLSGQVLFASLAAAVVVAGRVGAELVETRERLRRERRVSAEQQAQRELAEQKARIARDLHDVIAHSMSLISVRAASASARLGDLDAPVAEEFDQIAASARQALQEMRQVLTVLRPGPTDPATGPGTGAATGPATGPAPGLAEIADLVEAARDAGHAVTLRGTDAEVDDLTGLAAYRIVQEALSNAARHAPGSEVTVSLAETGDRLEIEVANSAPTAPAVPVAAGGLGVHGMTERAGAVGGTLSTGPREDGGYVVAAALPLTGRAAR